MRVNRFGVHWAPGRVAFLLQQNGTQNAISNTIPSPYEVITRRSCPHEIDLSLSPVAPPDDPAFHALSPAPRCDDDPISWLIHDPDGTFILAAEKLTYMSSPTEPIIGPMWWKTPREVAFKASITNVAPIVFTSVTFKNCGRMETISQAVAPSGRRLVFISKDKVFPPTGGKRLSTSLTLKDVADLPHRQIGTYLMRKHMLDG